MSYPLQPLSSLGDIQTGSTPLTSKSDYWGGDIPFVTPGDLDQILLVSITPRTLSDEGAQQSRILQKDAVMVCCIGSLGKIGIAGRTVVTNQQINSIEFDPKKIWPKFGFYACQRLKPRLITMAPATTIAIVSKSKFGQLEIPVPPLPEQRRIAAILDQADALRAKRREALAQLDSLTQSIFIEMFGDPVKNPKGWPLVRFASLLENIDSGWSPVCMDRAAQGDEWGVLKLGAVTSCVYKDLENKALPDGVAFDSKIEVKPGDLLFSRKNTYNLVAACVLVDATRERLMLSDLIFRFRLNADAKVEKRYLQSLFVFPTKRSEVQKLAGGSSGSMPNISKGRLLELDIELPPLSLQQIYSTRIQSIEALKATHRTALAELDTLFASLQHRAFRGEL